MTQRINPNIADALDMEMPDEPPIEESAPLALVEPHEVIQPENPECPDMSDIEVKFLEGEKQMEQLIGAGMGMFTELYQELPKIEPKYRNRHLEITAMIMAETRAAIEHKTNIQLKRKDQRMKEAEFGKGKNQTNIGTANFFGSREELLQMIQDADTEPVNGEAPADDDSQ